MASTESPAKTPRPKKGTLATNGRGRGRALDCVEIPKPPRRSSRPQTVLKSSPNRASPKKATAKASGSSPAQSRKPSLKRKLSPGPVPYAKRQTEGVHLPGEPEFPSTTNSQQPDSVRPSPPKKLRLSSPVSDLTPLTSSSGYEVDPDELVPTSQSDEQELTLPRIPERDPAFVQESVAKWRQDTNANPPSRTQSPPPLDPICTSFDDVPMDVDATPVEVPLETSSMRSMPYPQTPRSSSDGCSHQQHLDDALATVTRTAAYVKPSSPAATPSRVAPNPMASPSDAFSSLTPPPSSDSISGPEPEEEPQVIQPLDVKSKTDQLIADIKARAYAAAHSSPEQSPLALDSLSDSDSDSDSDSSDMRGGFAAMLTKDTKGKGKAKAKAAATPSKSESASAPRYNLRRVSPSNAPKRYATPLTQQRKPSKANPLDGLLREKAREERTGMGMAAIRSAEAAFARVKEDAKKGLKEEMADEEGSDSDDDWRAGIGLLGTATRGAKKAKATRAKSKGEDDDGDESEDEASAGAILASKSGKAVGKILESDKLAEKARALAMLNAEPVGVPLWNVSTATADVDDSMDADFVMPTFPVDAGDNAMFQLLGHASRSKDAMQVSALLASGFVTLLAPEQCKSVVPWLFELVFSDVPATLSSLAYTQLMRLAPLLEAHPSGLCPSLVHSALVRLGASRSTLETYGWIVPTSQAAKFAFTDEQRGEMVFRFVSLLGAFAHAPVGEGLRDYFLAALLVGMDPTATDDLLMEIHKTCDAIGCAIDAAQGDSFHVEASLCTMIAGFGKTLSPLNQARLISLLPCVSPCTTRLARNVGRSLLMEAPASPRGYEKLPDLSPVVQLLSPAVGSGAYFDVAGNADKEGYHDELTSRVSLLSRVLSDIPEYTSLEVQAAKEQAAKEKAHKDAGAPPAGEAEQGEHQDGEKEKEEQASIIEQVRTQLEMLHGKIVDTRAAHLDRSRAKAVIQRLNLRVHYQRTAALKSGPRSGKPRTINSFFSAPS
ncbi:uncharacterized protein TRAVEDRAFT_69101 [Trametes versicolor FP-101664 SS1]|uniref:uncharacterized protein n=1 Tax=Trametes versicolor (strain FP-101664) TaxID=717944 RepID=UPI0004623489|nr:uncharacterized protein TRAVEDRAFT_69101 [Trametes versicolor FP-101664 SS1]EIW62887.1 hypothetical protein TRAVEDRAFT_69101 [Trametes versicolor FP-101664 SS1]